MRWAEVARGEAEAIGTTGHGHRWWWWALFVAACAAALVVREVDPRAPWLPGCPLHLLTGLHCAGCGMTRATHALLNGQFVQAMAFNPLAALVCPAWLGRWAWERWRRGASLWTRHPRFAWGMMALLATYTVARNLPWYPFTLLAPGGW